MKRVQFLLLLSAVTVVAFFCFARRNDKTVTVNADKFSNHAGANISSDHNRAKDSTHSGADVVSAISSNLNDSSSVNSVRDSVAGKYVNSDRRRAIHSSSGNNAVYLSRLKEADLNAQNAPPERVKELSEMLNEKFSAQKELSLLEFNAIKNNILDKLLSQNELPVGIGMYMVEMYRDRSHDDLWRDYCVQHFYLYCDRKVREGGINASDPAINAIKSAYWDAAAETETTIAGSALLGLERLSRLDPNFDRARLERIVLNYAMNENTPLKTRITAMQLCGVTQQESILPAARTVAQETKSIPLQIAAIAAIGDVGDASDVAFLEKLTSTTTGYARNSANSSLARLKKRLNVM